jgi:hypothetical protein
MSRREVEVPVVGSCRRDERQHNNQLDKRHKTQEGRGERQRDNQPDMRQKRGGNEKQRCNER